MIVAAFSLALPVTASAATPCWLKVYEDWREDDRIDGQYPLSCLEQAMARLPADLRDYSDFPDAVSRARRTTARLNRDERNERSVGPVGQGDDTTPKSGLFDEAIGKLGPENADSAPIPLLILAGLAMLLIAAGAGGLIARRVQGKRVRGGPPPPAAP